jgi:hypothetical protein
VGREELTAANQVEAGYELGHGVGD